MRARTGSKSAPDSPYPGPKKTTKSHQRGRGTNKLVLNAPFLILALRRSMQARASSSGLCPPGLRFCMMRSSHLRVSHTSLGFRARPRGWWDSSAMFMRRLCDSFRARRPEGMAQQDHRGRLRVGKRRRHKVERRGCYSKKAWTGDKCG